MTVTIPVVIHTELSFCNACSMSTNRKIVVYCKKDNESDSLYTALAIKEYTLIPIAIP
jgi:hypothetical protein